MLTEVSAVGDGLKKKKYHNDLMALHKVDEEKLAMAMAEEEDSQFAEYANTARDSDDDDDENDDDDGDGNGDGFDAEKYTVIDGDGTKRTVNPLNDLCELCERMMPLTWHHLIPKCTHNDYMRRHPNVTRLYLNKHGTWICRQCHSAIHGIHSNKELMKSYSTVQLLLECDSVQKWIGYISKRKASHHWDRKGKKQNMVARLGGDKKDRSTKIQYIQ